MGVAHVANNAAGAYRDFIIGLEPRYIHYPAKTGIYFNVFPMLADLLTAAVVYVGEKHTSAAHHAVQLQLLRALHHQSPRLAVAMEMFDRSYQPVLDRWSAGQLDEDGFLRSTHWYANWRFDYALYREILAYVRDHRLRLVALNLPFNIPPKIRVGGIEHLSPYEKGFLPVEIEAAGRLARTTRAPEPDPGTTRTRDDSPPAARTAPDPEPRPPAANAGPAKRPVRTPLPTVDVVDPSPRLPCPDCGRPMDREFFNLVYRIPIDRCRPCKARSSPHGARIAASALGIGRSGCWLQPAHHVRLQPPLGTCLVYVQRISLSDWATGNIVPPSTARVPLSDGSVQE